MIDSFYKRTTSQRCFCQAGLTSWQLLLVIVTSGAVVLAANATRTTLEGRSVRAEARLMLAYMRTLQSAYHVDEGRYIVFPEPYGAASGGMSRCQRPAGAVELGFVLRRCEDSPAEGGLRYAYRAVPMGADLGPETWQAGGYVGYAESGSDANNESFVCASADQVDRWEVTSESDIRQVEACD